MTVVYWRDIPVQILSGSGRSAVRIKLSDRFQEAVDRAATRAGLVGSDEYLTEWHKVEVPYTDPEEVASRLESEHPPEVLDELVRNHGRHP